MSLSVPNSDTSASYATLTLGLIRQVVCNVPLVVLFQCLKRGGSTAPGCVHASLTCLLQDQRDIVIADLFLEHLSHSLPSQRRPFEQMITHIAQDLKSSRRGGKLMWCPAPVSSTSLSRAAGRQCWAEGLQFTGISWVILP